MHGPGQPAEGTAGQGWDARAELAAQLGTVPHSPFKLLQEDVEVQALLGVQKSNLETPF